MAEGTLKTVDVALGGMTCGHCVATVEKALLALNGVRSASADLASQSARVEFDPCAADVSALNEAVAEAGYAPQGQSGDVALHGISPLRPSVRLAGIQAAPRPASDPEEWWLAIEGMTCASCVRSVEQAAMQVAGVAKCEVSLTEASARVVLDPDKVALDNVLSAIRDAGYGAAPRGKGASAEDGDEAFMPLRRRVVVSAALTAPLLVLAMSHGLLAFKGSVWLQLCLALPVMVYGGAPFFSAAWNATRHLRADMNTLIALGTGAAFSYSCAAASAPHLVSGGGAAPVYFETAATIITLVLVGRLLETRARHSTSESIRKLVALQSGTVRVRRGGRETEIRLEDVNVGDLILVRPGERVPVDGTVIEGSSAVDESPITGESVPVDKAAGSRLTSGSLNGEGFLAFRAEKVGSETALSRIIEFVRRAQSSKAPAARLADRIAGVFVPAILIVAIATFAAWMLAGPEERRLQAALTNAVSVLIIACPCALGLATPAALAVGVGRAAERGILIRDAEALEAARSVDTVVFDKTGTLTLGQFEVTDIETFDGTPKNELLSRAGAIERLSEHPIAKAIAAECPDAGLVVEDYRALPGAGASARLNGELWLLGNRELIAGSGAETSAADPVINVFGRDGKTVVLAARNGSLVGSFALRDTIRPESRAATAALAGRGVKTLMISGDNQPAARAIGRLAGIEDVLARVLPVEKSSAIRRLQSEGRTVAMVGDGINDAPALAQADVGVAIGAGTDIAVESAGIVLVRSNPLDVDRAINVSRRIHRTILQNYCWAFGYNVIGVPVAAGVLYPWTGWLLTPIVASVAMALSSLSVLSNSLRLKRSL